MSEQIPLYRCSFLRLAEHGIEVLLRARPIFLINHAGRGSACLVCCLPVCGESQGGEKKGEKNKAGLREC